jgi:hypothetical protein
MHPKEQKKKPTPIMAQYVCSSSSRALSSLFNHCQLQQAKKNLYELLGACEVA